MNAALVGGRDGFIAMRILSILGPQGSLEQIWPICVGRQHCTQ